MTLHRYIAKTSNSFRRIKFHTPDSTILGRLYPAAPRDSFDVVCPPGRGSNATVTGAGLPLKHLGTPSSLGSPSYAPPIATSAQSSKYAT
ncbi:jg8962 [Pararge aegeria aegeria]|uniref:Jg8962 protein n=1 Tax=Pararge aegeria aegeria TaxID=348720 RepID=A0A8S4SHN6_9NEOP|nr:jg8962 [Pararge aegeria aegeria]